jgi:F0F1-type ATP synthase assembly protein I
MIRTAWELSAGVLSFVVAIALGWWFGGVLDGWFGTAPWLMIVFSCFGLAAGVLNVYRTVSRAMRASAGPRPAHDALPGHGPPGPSAEARRHERGARKRER